MRNAAAMPRAPVIAFQPAIAGAREASGVWALTMAVIPTSMDALAAPKAKAITQSRTTLGATA